jgi:predicted dehydrogenase
VRDRLKIGVVGAGAVIERYHMPAISGIPEVVRTIVVDADGERARRIADRYNFPSSSSDLSELAENCDVAIVAVPNGQHATVSCELLARGVHVLCEKPMARNRDECVRMIEASRRGCAQLCIGHNRRFRQHVGLAKKLLDRGLIGEVTKVDAEEGSSSDWPRSQAYFDPALAGGGALLDTGVHSIDLIRWLVGEFDDVEYKGNGAEDRVESDAELQFLLATGATGKISVSRNRTLLQKLTIVGTEGSLEIGLWEPSLGVRCGKGKVFENFERLDVAVSRRPPLDTSFVDQLRNVVSAVRGEEQLLVNGAEGMSAVEVVCRAYQGDASTPLPRALASGERR